MKANQLKGEYLLKEVEDLYEELNDRIYEIEKAGYSLKKDASHRFRELQKKVPNNFSELNDKELRSIYRELKYIDDLKTSTLRGAEEAQTMYKDIEDIVDKLGPRVKQRFWKLYDNLYERNQLAALAYKYDILNALSTSTEKSRSKMKDMSRVEEEIMNMFDILETGFDGDYTSPEFSAYLTDTLQYINTKYKDFFNL